MNVKWLILPAGLAFLAVIILALGRSFSAELRNLCFIGFCLFLLWGGVAIQLRFKNAWATGLVVVGGLLVGLVALGALTPVQLLEQAKSIRSGGKE